MTTLNHNNVKVVADPQAEDLTKIFFSKFLVIQKHQTTRLLEILLAASMPELKVWYATVQISWIGQWKNWSAWIGKLERYCQ